VKMTMTRRLHFLVVNLRENVKIVCLCIIQWIALQISIKITVRTAEITTNFRKVRVIALTALIFANQVIIRAIVLK
jgi:hypothetical protein